MTFRDTTSAPLIDLGFNRPKLYEHQAGLAQEN